MVSSNYRQAFKSAIARIYHANGTVVGAGFLVGNGQLLTCAHVVTAALGLPTKTQEAPTDMLSLDFPLIAPGQKVRASVVFWRPVQLEPLNASETGEDMAGLALEGAPSDACQPVRLVAAADLWAHPFQIFGFPSQRDEGIWASGVIRDRLANGWVQIEDIKAQGHPVQPGFSGAPIWDEQVEGVVGMAVAADKKRDETRTAFMIPTALLAQEWLALAPLSQVSVVQQSVRSRVQKIRCEALTERFKALAEDYKAAYNQWSLTLSEVDRNRLKRQADSLEQELNQLDQELEELGC